MMSDEAKCSDCGATVSYDTGFTMTGGLSDSAQDRIWCPVCAPDTGSGYTLSDLQKMQEDNQTERAKYQMTQMEALGPEVYFHVTGPNHGPT